MVSSALALLMILAGQQVTQNGFGLDQRIAAAPSQRGPPMVQVDESDDSDNPGEIQGLTCDTPEHKAKFTAGATHIMQNVRKMVAQDVPIEVIKQYGNGEITRGLTLMHCTMN